MNSINSILKSLKDISTGISWATSLNVQYIFSSPPSDMDRPSLIHGMFQTYEVSNASANCIEALGQPACPWTTRCLSMIPIGAMLVGFRDPNSRVTQAAQLIHKNLGHVAFVVNVVATVALFAQASPVVTGVMLTMLSIDILNQSGALPSSVAKTIKISNFIFRITMVTLFGSIKQKIFVVAIHALVFFSRSSSYQSTCLNLRDWLYPVPKNLTCDEVSSIAEVEALTYRKLSGVNLAHLYRTYDEASPLHTKVYQTLQNIRLEDFHSTLPECITRNPKNSVYQYCLDMVDLDFQIKENQETPELVTIIGHWPISLSPEQKKSALYQQYLDCLLKIRQQLTNEEQVKNWWEQWRKERGVTEIVTPYSETEELKTPYLIAMLVEMGVFHKPSKFSNLS